MVTKILGSESPDGSTYTCVTDGNGNLLTTTPTVAKGSSRQILGKLAPDGSRYITLTDGNGNLK